MVAGRPPGSSSILGPYPSWNAAPADNIGRDEQSATIDGGGLVGPRPAVLGHDRVVFLTEPPMLERAFGNAASNDQASPELWADAYSTAFAEVSGARVVTFDQALAHRCPGSNLLLA